MAASVNDYYTAISQARQVAASANCPRCSVGAVILDKNGEPIGHGCNTLAESFCPCSCDCGTPSMEKGSSTCQAIHAEIMAVFSVSTMYRLAMDALVSTRPPCYNCLSFLATTSIKKIVVTKEFGDRDHSAQRWMDIGRAWIEL